MLNKTKIKANENRANLIQTESNKTAIWPIVGTKLTNSTLFTMFIHRRRIYIFVFVFIFFELHFQKTATRALRYKCSSGWLELKFRSHYQLSFCAEKISVDRLRSTVAVRRQCSLMFLPPLFIFFLSFLVLLCNWHLCRDFSSLSPFPFVSLGIGAIFAALGYVQCSALLSSDAADGAPSRFRSLAELKALVLSISAIDTTNGGEANRKRLTASAHNCLIHSPKHIGTHFAGIVCARRLHNLTASSVARNALRFARR